MSIATIISVLLQATGLFLVVRFLGNRVLGYKGALLAIAMFVYHGLTEIVTFFFPACNRFRLAFDLGGDLDLWMILVGVSVFAYCCVYVWTLRWRNNIPYPGNDYRILSGVSLYALVPIWFILYVYAAGFVSYFPASLRYVLLGFYDAFFYPVYVLLFLKIYFSVRGAFVKLSLFILFVFLLLFTGSRGFSLYIVIGAMSCLVRYGVRIRRRMLLPVFIVMAMLILNISVVRSIYEGDYLRSGNLKKASAAGDLVRLQAESYLQAFKDDFVYRIDANSFPAAIMQARKYYKPFCLPIKEAWIANAALFLPRFINPYKPEEGGREEQIIREFYFNDIQGDFNAGMAGILYATYGPAGIFLTMMLLGYLFAKVDIWIWSYNTMYSLATNLYLTYLVLFYELGVESYWLQLRYLLVLFMLIFAYRRIKYRIFR